MKTYIVELKYTSYTQFEVEAKNSEQAEVLAWKQLERVADSIEPCGDWTCDSIEELNHD
jgi:hypothetical protein